LAVHCGNGVDADFSPYQKHSLEALGCPLLSSGEDMQRRQFISLVGGAAAAWPLAAHAQQPAMPVIGYLSGRSPDAEGPLRTPLLAALEEAGFVVGRNVAIEYRFAEGLDERQPLAGQSSK
jgi:hypothetical protein